MKGFTFLELILVMGIVAILVGVATPFLSSFMVRNNWYSGIDLLETAIIKAQNYAMDGKTVNGSRVWGVCMRVNKIRLFNADCDSANYREEFTLPNLLVVTGLDNLNFDNPRGEPNSPMEIAVATEISSKTIVINEAGMVEVN